MSTEAFVEQVMSRVVAVDADSANRAVIEAAVRESINITHEARTPEATYEAVIQTLRSAWSKTYL
jgi:CheY-like chemotaxis protein